MKAEKWWKEFRGFALKGSIPDLAVAVVIGTAFGSVVSSLVKNVIMPLFSYVLPAQESYQKWKIGRVEIGTFLGELLNFLVIAGAMFLIMVKLLGFLRNTKLLPSIEPETKVCPLCLSTIPIKARKCAHCTADLEPEAKSPEPE